MYEWASEWVERTCTVEGRMSHRPAYLIAQRRHQLPVNLTHKLWELGSLLRPLLPTPLHDGIAATQAHTASAFVLHLLKGHAVHTATSWRAMWTSANCSWSTFLYLYWCNVSPSSLMWRHVLCVNVQSKTTKSPDLTLALTINYLLFIFQSKSLIFVVVTLFYLFLW